jgi:hypothetical protein
MHICGAYKRPIAKYIIVKWIIKNAQTLIMLQHILRMNIQRQEINLLRISYLEEQWLYII